MKLVRPSRAAAERPPRQSTGSGGWQTSKHSMPNAFITKADAAIFNDILGDYLRQGAAAGASPFRGRIHWGVGGTFPIYNKTLAVMVGNSMSLELDGAGYPVILQPAATLQVVGATLALSGLTLDGSNLPANSSAVNCTSQSTLRLSSIRIINCDAGADRSPIQAWDSVKLHLTSVDMRYNKGGMGGALSLRRTSNPDLGGLASAETRVAKSTFYSNQATSYGGALYLGHGSVYLSSSTFEGNDAALGGGAVALPSMLPNEPMPRRVMIEASTFSGGGTGCGPAADAVFHHPVGGGALLTERATTISGCRFFYNAARQSCRGGAIVAGARLSLRSVVFEGNSAEGHGGAIWLSGAGVRGSRCTFTDNKAQVTGGAIHLDGPTDEGSSHSQSSSWTPVAVLLDSAFNRNAVVPALPQENSTTLACGGGGLSISGSQALLANTTFDGDTAEGDCKGSDVFVQNASALGLFCCHMRLQGPNQQVWLNDSMRSSSIKCRGTQALAASAEDPDICGLSAAPFDDASQVVNVLPLLVGVLVAGVVAAFVLDRLLLWMLHRGVSRAKRWARKRPFFSSLFLLALRLDHFIEALLKAGEAVSRWPVPDPEDVEPPEPPAEVAEREADEEDVEVSQLVFEGRKQNQYEITCPRPVTSSPLARVYMAWNRKRQHPCMIRLYRAGALSELAIETEKHTLNVAAQKIEAASGTTSLSSSFLPSYLDDFVHERAGFFLVLRPRCVESLETRLWRASRPPHKRQPSDDMPYTTVVRYLYQISCGLKALASMRLLHGQLSLSTVLLTGRDQVRLVDFGDAPNEAVRMKLRRFGRQEENFMAPECRDTSAYDVPLNSQMDAWSLGAIAYTLACSSLSTKVPTLPLAFPPKEGPWWSARGLSKIDPDFSDKDSELEGAFMDVVELLLQAEPKRRLTVASAQLILRQLHRSCHEWEERYD